MKKENILRSLYIDELKDLHNAEQQLVKALPKMAKAATSADLRDGFKEHLEQTKEHASRLEQVLKGLGETVKGKKCKGIEGIVSEGGEVISGDFEGALKDAALVSAAQRVEHYEIAAYGTVHAFAVLMGEAEAASLLEQTLEEEKQTNQKLTELSEKINSEALGDGAEVADKGPKPMHKTVKAGSSR